MTNKEDDKDLKIKELEFEYRWMSFWMSQKVTQERFRKEIPNSQ
jgi:hypothetical protein